MKTSSAHAFVNQMLVYSLVAIGFTGSVGLGTVWTRRQISIIANSNKALALSLNDVDRRYEQTTAEIAAEQDPVALQQRNLAWHLGLVPPSEMPPDQVRRVTQDPEQLLAMKHNRDLFQDGVTAVSFRVAAQP